MSRPTPLFLTLSIRQLAAETRFARDTVRSRLRDAQIKPHSKRGGHDVYRLRDALPALYYSAGADDPDRLKPFERNAFYRSEREKLHLEMERGDLVPAIEVEQTISNIFKVLVAHLETLPDVLERDAGATPQQLQSAEQHMDRLRDELHKAVVETVRPEQFEGSKLDRGCAFLAEVLADGPRLAGELFDAARAVGISRGTLRRAKAALTVSSRRVGRAWEWSLRKRE